MMGPSAGILALGLSSRKNLCVNPNVVSAENRDSVDAACRKLTASWVRAMAIENRNVPTCGFYENYEKVASNLVLPPGVYTLQVPICEANFILFLFACLLVFFIYFCFAETRLIENFKKRRWTSVFCFNIYFLYYAANLLAFVSEFVYILPIPVTEFIVLQLDIDGLFMYVYGNYKIEFELWFILSFQGFEGIWERKRVVSVLYSTIYGAVSECGSL